MRKVASKILTSTATVVVMLGLWATPNRLGAAEDVDLTPEYMTYEEQKIREAAMNKTTLQDISEDGPEVLKVRMGRLTIAHILGAGTTVVLSKPEIAEVHVEPPDFLFIRGTAPGETELLVADKKLRAIYSARLVIVPADADDTAMQDNGPPPVLSEPATASPHLDNPGG